MAKSKKKVVRALALGSTAMGVVAHVDPVEIGEGFAVTVNGLQVTGTPQFEEWERVGKLLRVSERSAQFALGDFLIEVEKSLGENRAAQIVDYSSGWSEETCRTYRWVASRIAPSDRRMDKLGIKHHMVVASLTPAKQRKWLTAAAESEDKPWTVARLSKALADGEDAPATGWFVVVRAKDEQDQTALMERLEREGYSVKATTQRRHASTGMKAVA